MPKVIYSGVEYNIRNIDAFEYYQKRIIAYQKEFNTCEMHDAGYSQIFFDLRKAISDMEHFIFNERNKK